MNNTIPRNQEEVGYGWLVKTVKEKKGKGNKIGVFRGTTGVYTISLKVESQNENGKVNEP